MKTRRGFALTLVLCFALSLFAFGGTAYAAQGGVASETVFHGRFRKGPAL